MFDISSVNKRYFEIDLHDIFDEETGIEYKAHLEVEPPTHKSLNKILELSGCDEKTADKELQKALRMILNKNKTRYKVPQELIENLDTDQTTGILTEYFNWLDKEKNGKN